MKQQEPEMSSQKHVNDIRSTSYNAATANPNGYTGTIEDVITQIRAEPEEVRGYWPLNISRARRELLDFLGVTRKPGEYSGQRGEASGVPVVWTGRGFRRLFLKPEDDTVEYGVPEPGFYTLAYARKAWPQSFSDSV
jgi:hypothetical protein